jgi:hypothetical protein
MILRDALESIMLLCFGLAWPVANLRMLRTRRSEGKGLAFTLIVMVGYLAGTCAKWISGPPGAPLPGVFWLYAVSGASVTMNLSLQWYSPECQPGCSSEPEIGNPRIVLGRLTAPKHSPARYLRNVRSRR